MIRKKLLGGCAVLSAIAMVVLISAAYYRFASNQIYQESVSHLNEIYTQIAGTFRTTMSKNWRLLHSWRGYIADAGERPEEFLAFIQEEKEEWHFTTFYFLARDGRYVTALGEAGRMDLGEDLVRLTDGQEDIVADGILSGGQKVTVFAVPTRKGAYGGLDYEAVGISFNASDMTGALSINAFGGQSDCYVTYPDGQVVFSSRLGGRQPDNFLSYLRDSGGFEPEETDALDRDWQEGNSRIITCALEGEPYYLCYQPVGFAGWMLVSGAPVGVVNASINRFIVVTFCVMAALCVIIVSCVAAFIVQAGRRRMLEKNREIRSREQLFNLLTQNTEDIFILFSPEDFTAQYVSPNLERVLGLNAEDIGRDVRPLLFSDADSLFPDEHALTPQVLKEVPVGGVWTGERDMLHTKTHELRWFKQLVHHCTLEMRDQFILMLSDRTKEQQMNETLGEALNTARAANEAKSNFLANMSHDIRTPMNAIVGFSALLNRDADDPEKVREYTRKISSSSQHLLGLINDILDMSKIESGKTSLNMTEFSLPLLLDELYTMMLPQARAKKQNLEVHTRGAVPELLLGDKLRLSQVLINLLSNAVKYTQPEGEISLTVEELEQNTPSHAHLRFAVADNGYGMSAGFVQVIFDPFAREVTEATREIQGTGLGMAITKNIVDLMGGTISVDSELGQGSTFTVEVELAAAGGRRDPDFWVRHGIGRMLAADDEEDICRSIQEAMKGFGVEVSYATGGAGALEQFQAAQDRGEPFRLVLLDWRMPEMDGLEAARRIRQAAGGEPPIIILTSYDLEEAREAAVDSGIDSFLPKPFFPSSLQRLAAQLLEGGETDGKEESGREEISLKGLRVLAAEDNEINAEILLELLEIEGVHCEVMPNGQEALNRFLRSRPGEFDMIFMDIQMPVMDGYETARAIRSSSHPMARTIPIIAMTANAFEEDIQAALAAGMSAHTAKPLDMERLKAVISMLRQGSKAIGTAT